MPIPVLGGLLPFRPREAAKDALAGLTLASMNIPQVLGYTRIAGTPVVTGLYTVLLPLVGFALFGSSRHLVVAADSATAAIFSSALSRMAPIGEREIHGAGRHADAADRRPPPHRAHLQARVPGRLPVPHGARRLSDRRRRPGRRRDARATCSASPPPRTGRSANSGRSGRDCRARAADPRPVGIRGRRHPSRALVRSQVSRAAGRRRRHDRRERLARSRRPRRRGDRAGARRPAGAALARRELERDAGAAAGRGLVLRHDHRPERRDLARLRDQASGAGRRERRHPRACGRQCRGGADRRLRRQRQPDPDGDGRQRRREEPGRPARVRRRRRDRARGAHRVAAIPSALRAGRRSSSPSRSA